MLSVMTIPKFNELFTQVLDELSDGKPWTRNDLFDAVVDKLNLTPEEREEKISAGYSRAKDRVHWACAYLTYAEAVSKPKRGILQITDFGRKLLADNPRGVTLAQLEKTPGLIAWSERTIAAQKAKKGQSSDVKPQIVSGNAEGVSPLEQMESALASLNADVASEVLSRLRTEHWEFMERAVLKVLLRLGFGQDEEDLFHVGGSHDGGIDGIINQDKLGLDQIYVQSKRYKEGAGISRDTIASFIGAMDIKGVNKGVFITASHFTPEARKAVLESRNKQVVLIDGEELAQIMVQNQIGVAAIKSFTVYKIDENFFED